MIIVCNSIVDGLVKLTQIKGHMDDYGYLTMNEAYIIGGIAPKIPNGDLYGWTDIGHPTVKSYGEFGGSIELPEMKLLKNEVIINV